jgi:DNA (cytosine-5)-methyltransferase 1
MDQGGSVMNVLEDGTVGTLRRETHGHEPSIVQHMAVRRLTPTECERLQGFPDGYTDIKPNGKLTPDGPRYKALGNSMAVPVMKWIGEKINGN